MKQFTNKDWALVSALAISVGCTNVKLSSLQQMATAPAVMNHGSVVIDNYCPASGNHFVDFFILLRSLRIRSGNILTDWSRDGVPDVDKATLNLNVFSADQSGTGYGNLILYQAGILGTDLTKLQACADPGQATVPGWLTDCQRDFLQLNKVVDSVGRGFPDDLAVWFKVDLTDPQVGTQDVSGDGVSNLTKIKMNVTLVESMTPAIQAQAPVYEIDTTPSGNSTCYKFSVSNIALPNVSNGNLVVPYILSSDAQNNLSVKAPNILFPPSAADGTVMEFQYGAL